MMQKYAGGSSSGSLHAYSRQRATSSVLSKSMPRAIWIMLPFQRLRLGVWVRTKYFLHAHAKKKLSPRSRGLRHYLFNTLQKLPHVTRGPHVVFSRGLLRTTDTHRQGIGQSLE